MVANEINIDSIILNTQPIKFVRRTDLTAYDRMMLAIEAHYAQIHNLWGTITNLALFHDVSREFIYQQLHIFEQIIEYAFGTFDTIPKSEGTNDKKEAVETMLSLRLEGKCSIGSIVTIMKRFGLYFSGQGTISQYLNRLCSLLPNTLSTDANSTQFAVFLSDEIFADSVPILITVEPKSSSIFRIELVDKRRAEEWKNHWTCIEKNGFKAIYVVSDEGTGLCSGHDLVFDGLIRQPDTFHAVAHQLGIWEEHLGKAAYKAIEAEYDRERIINSARSEKVIAKRIKQYEEAKKAAEQAIDKYDNFCYLYHCIITELRPFRSNGNLRCRQAAEDTIQTALDLLEASGKKKIIKVVQKIRRTLPNLLNYFDVASKVVAKLKGLPIDDNALSSLCLAWQWHKGKIKAKKATRRKICNDKEQLCLEFAVGYLQDDYDDLKEHIYDELNSIVQSSALVECINSVIRPYLNTSRGQITQEALNLIMFYHNHRRYVAGERKGKTPMEILTGKKQEKDWVELLLEFVEEKDPHFFSKAA
ncbi:MAG: hypothetical protein U9Q67_02715 [Patescibacteria group bacterium]|nr:hypothetical protein [Patescibacteria group bacterium]